ncbi:MAG TPA: hypothetical protein VN948_15405 [Terriglobales bacterium]|nr:hypothetical protein [Terriglobales bacterium]
MTAANEKPDQDSAGAEGQLVSRLLEEYKILQDKIDKIGGFRFTIKGWSITVIIASIFAGSATKAVPRWLWAISLVVFLAVFFIYERQQTNYRYRFAQRSLLIEDVLSRLLRNLAKKANSEPVRSSFVILHFVPGIGRHLRDKPRQPGPRKRRTFWQSCWEADVVFYIAQAAVVLLFLVFAPAQPESRGQGDIGIVINGKMENGPPIEAPSQPPSGKSGTDEKKSKTKEKHKSN